MNLEHNSDPRERPRNFILTCCAISIVTFILLIVVLKPLVFFLYEGSSTSVEYTAIVLLVVFPFSFITLLLCAIIADKIFNHIKS